MSKRLALTLTVVSAAITAAISGCVAQAEETAQDDSSIIGGTTIAEILPSWRSLRTKPRAIGLTLYRLSREPHRAPPRCTLR